MPSFEERVAEVKQQYAAAATTQNHRLFRQAMKEHEDLVKDEGVNGTEEVTQAMLASGWRILGEPVTGANIRELIDLVSSMREDMTDSQRLGLFMEDLLSPRQPLDDKPQVWATPSAASQRRISRYLERDKERGSRRVMEYDDIDMTPNRSIGGAGLGIALVLTCGAIIAAVLYALNQLV